MLSEKDLKHWAEITKGIKKLKNRPKESALPQYDSKKHYENQLESEKNYHDSFNYININDDKGFQIEHPEFSEDFIDAKRATIDKKTLTQLKQGKIGYTNKFDLHGLHVQQARQELYHFLQTSQKLGHRCVLIIHGKGRSTESSMGQIKQKIPYWLASLDVVLAFCSAQNKHGGTGALYVLLKK